MDRVIQTLPATVSKQPKRKHVAAYARVSTGKDAMLHSLSAQVSFYGKMIRSHPEWQFAGVYSDEAISGTRDQRPGLQALMTDCRAGKIDLVLVKSISRLARNTVILLETVRELKTLDVDVFFEEQNIHTLSSEGELLLTILASYAQEEALSVSENMKWRVRKNFEEGKPWSGTMLGYRYCDGTLVVEPEEAEIVRRIFTEYLSGKGGELIAKELNEDGFKTRYGKSWHRESVLRVLRNECYTGNLLLQKTYRPDCLSKRKERNDGALPKYYAEATHEAIIPAEVFDQTQREITRRADCFSPEGTQHRKRYPLSGKITCACCGKHYRRKVTHGGPVWICSTYNERGKAACPSKQIPEAVLEELCSGLDVGVIERITAAPGNRLTVHMNDGTEFERTWVDRSRALSWTEEMRQRAAAQAKERYRK